MPTRLRLSCRAVLVVVLVRRNCYSAGPCMPSSHQLHPTPSIMINASRPGACSLVYYTSVDCNPLTALLRVVLDLLYTTCCCYSLLCKCKFSERCRCTATFLWAFVDVICQRRRIFTSLMLVKSLYCDISFLVIKCTRCCNAEPIQQLDPPTNVAIGRSPARQRIPQLAHSLPSDVISHHLMHHRHELATYCARVTIRLAARTFQFGQKKFRFDSIRQSDKFAACTLIFI